MVERFSPIGLSFDIIGQPPCYCKNCKRDMRAGGVDLHDPEAVWRFADEVTVKYMRRMSQALWKLKPDMRISQNGPVKKGRYDIYDNLGQHGIESLPTGPWGYDHFTQNVKYIAKIGLDYYSVTGKFHRSWGEFGGYKWPFALKHECDQIIAFGAKCGIGDQLHPSGRMDEETYCIIGEAYRDVAAKQKWCEHVTPVSEIAVVCPSAVRKDPRVDDAEVGASMMLFEDHALFDMIDETMPFDGYRLLILPDDVLMNEALKAKLAACSAAGGRLILSGESALDPRRKRFQLDVGAEYGGASEWQFDYTLVSDAIAKNMVRSPFLNYTAGVKTRVTDGEVLARTIAPYFNRTYRRFCSHANTPHSQEAEYPAVIRKGQTIYIAAKIFTLYRQHGMKLYRDLVVNCVNLLLPKRMLTVDLPSGGRVTLMKRENGNQYVIHLLYATPIKRGSVEVLEDCVPLYHIPVAFRTREWVESVELVPGGKPISFRRTTRGISFTLPKLLGHQMAVLSFASTGATNRPKTRSEE
ncbi:MAG: hypothetical protein NTW86_07365 [Candidatus Sumerlaeota bacterium]|nr:hypothetical protein [Candidatus Sumerlaeota bacterium]